MGELSDAPFKIVLLGDAGVGKTALIARIVDKNVADGYSPTTGPCFSSRIIKLPSGARTLNFWDTAGQEQYRSMVGCYLRDAAACIIVFDTSDSRSFKSLDNWFAFAKHNSNDAALFLFGNKTDLAESRAVSVTEAIGLADEGACRYFEGSAKTGDGVTAAVEQIAGALSEIAGKARGLSRIVLRAIRRPACACA